MNFSKKNHEHKRIDRKVVSKTRLTLLILLISVIAYAQQGINYKAVIKDNLGNVVTEQPVDIQFSILKGVAQTIVYTETHIPTTDANGIVIVNIGEGTPNQGTFPAIDWGSDDHFLNVKINTGSGLTDMGTTQFMAVPYALNAKNTAFTTKNGVTSNSPGNIADDNFVFGSNQLNYNNAGVNVADRRMFFNKDRAAFRAGATVENFTAPFPFDGTAWNSAHIGLYSFASGQNPLASGGNSIAMGYNSQATKDGAVAIGSTARATGDNSVAIGRNTSASGNYSTATGHNTTASGINSISTGYGTIALGNVSTAMGSGTTATAALSTVIGVNNIGGGNATTWVSADPLFEIGNGNSTAPSNALTVLKNGKVGIGTHTPNSKLQITNGNDVSVTGGLGFLVLGNATGLNIGIDDNEIMARSNGNIATLSLNIEGGEVATGGAVNLNQGVAGEAVALKVNGAEALWYNGSRFSWGYGGTTNFFADNVGIGITAPNVALDVNGDIEYTGTITDVSDRRLKENFKPITNVLEQLQNINGYSYNMKDDADKTREYGVIAQDVQNVFPEMVKVIDDKEHLGVSYIQLIPVLLEAIKEQQKIIETQKTTINKQDSTNAQQSEILEALLARVEVLEFNTSK